VVAVVAALSALLEVLLVVVVVAQANLPLAHLTQGPTTTPLVVVVVESLVTTHHLAAAVAPHLALLPPLAEWEGVTEGMVAMVERVALAVAQAVLVLPILA
jgi:hypothetical protein